MAGMIGRWERGSGGDWGKLDGWAGPEGKEMLGCKKGACGRQAPEKGRGYFSTLMTKNGYPVMSTVTWEPLILASMGFQAHSPPTISVAP